jgi:hypothetical protein
MKVLLISANTEQINMPTLPLGLACVAASARKAGHTVRYLFYRGKGQSEMPAGSRQGTGGSKKDLFAESLLLAQS